MKHLRTNLSSNCIRYHRFDFVFICMNFVSYDLISVPNQTPHAVQLVIKIFFVIFTQKLIWQFLLERMHLTLTQLLGDIFIKFYDALPHFKVACLKCINGIGELLYLWKIMILKRTHAFYFLKCIESLE